jgi:hypothetical protein
MKRLAPLVFALLGLLAAAPLAAASDVSLRTALKPYEARLTTDIGYLSSFSAPSRSAAPAVLSMLSKVRSALSGATLAASRQQGSSSSGRKGRAQVLSALGYATAAADEAGASANAARAGNRSAAKLDAKQEQSKITKAIPLFKSGGSLLHLF